MTPPSAERGHLSIREVLEVLVEEFPDVTISKIRFLESRGLIHPERTAAGYRRFYQVDIERLRWILRQQREEGRSLKVIKGRLERDAPFEPSLFDDVTGDDVPPDPALARTGEPTLRADPEPAPREVGLLLPTGGVAVPAPRTAIALVEHRAEPLTRVVLAPPAAAPGVEQPPVTTVAESRELAARRNGRAAASHATPVAAGASADPSSVERVAARAAGGAGYPPRHSAAGALPLATTTRRTGQGPAPERGAPPRGPAPPATPAAAPHPPGRVPASRAGGAGAPAAGGTGPGAARRGATAGAGGAGATAGAGVAGGAGGAGAGATAGAGAGAGAAGAAPRAGATAGAGGADAAALARGAGATAGAGGADAAAGSGGAGTAARAGGGGATAGGTGATAGSGPTAAAGATAGAGGTGATAGGTGATAGGAGATAGGAGATAGGAGATAGGAGTTAGAGQRSTPQAPRGIHHVVTGASFSGEELAGAAGVEPGVIDELVEYGLITGRDVAGVRVYDEDALLVARAAAGFRAFGIEGRHLKAWRHAAEREAGLFSQVVTPLLRQRNPHSHERALAALVEMCELGAALRAHYVQVELRRLTGG